MAINDYLLKANEYIAAHKQSVNGKYRLKYHMMPPVGWMNDPNGLIKYGGEYHLYYQFNPYDTHSGTMCWGHFISGDLISYTDCGVAVAPEEEYSSIFSGGAIENEGKIEILYTRHFEQEDFKKEEVYKAYSVDGREFINGKRVFDNERLPVNLSRTDFRDPCPVNIDGRYYVFIGGKDTLQNKGVIIVLGGDTLDELKYEFYIGPFYELGDMGECPSYFRIDGKDVLLASGCHVTERGNDFMNINSSVFIVGDIDFKQGKMSVDYIKEIDKGDTFYAPQFIRGEQRPVMIGWLEMWNKPYPTRDMKHGWVGAFSIPRTISLKDGDIYQQPVESIKSYETEVKDGTVPKCADISFEIGKKGKFTLRGENGKIVIGNECKVYLDTRRSNNSYGSIRRTNGKYIKCCVRVLLDVSSIEVFVDNGKEVISSRIYIDGDYSIKTDGDVTCLTVKEIGGKA